MQYEEITKEEQIKWQKLAQNLSKTQRLFINLCSFEKCIWCNKEFKDGIILKTPGMSKDLVSYQWFIPEFLVHAQTTHGYSPDIIDMFLETMGNK